MLKFEKIWQILIILSVIGIILAVYLLYNFLTKPLVESCYINSIVNCDAVTKGSLSTLFGIPVPLIGLIGYIAIFLSAVLKKKRFVFGMSMFGMVFCLYITFQEIFLLKVICPVCLACQIVMFLIFIFSLMFNFRFKIGK